MGIIKYLKRLPLYVVLLTFVLFTLVPFYWILLTSFKTMKDITMQGPLGFPQIWHWDNYIRIWKVGNFLVYFKNSIIVTTISVLCIVLFSLLAAYSFSFLKIKGKGFILTLLLFGLIVPTELIIIPLYYNLKTLGLLNTLWAIILPQIALIIPIAVVLLRSFLRELPPSMLEAARIDGASEFKTLIYIIIPIAWPVIASITIFASIWTWNNFILPTILVQNDQWRTLPVGLNYFRGRYNMDFSMTATAANVIAFPIVIIYLTLQKRFIQGMTAGALKE